MLERIELDRAQRRVERDHERSSATANVGPRLAFALAPHRFGDFPGGGQVAAPRMALLTAFLTMTSFSLAALFSVSIAFADPILPSAIAAQARNSGSSRLPPMKPFAWSTPSSR